MSENHTKEGIEVQVGQVWRDLDARSGMRRGRVTHVGFGRATLELLDKVHAGANPSTTVRVRRMHKHSTGWELVKAEAASNESGQRGSAA